MLLNRRNLARAFNGLKKGVEIGADIGIALAKNAFNLGKDIVCILKEQIDAYNKPIDDEAYLRQRADVKKEVENGINEIREQKENAKIKKMPEVNINLSVFQIGFTPEQLKEFEETLKSKNKEFNEDFFKDVDVKKIVEVDSLSVEKMDKLDKVSEKVNGSFGIKYSRQTDKISVLIHDYDEKNIFVEEFNPQYECEERTEFNERMAKFFNNQLESGEEKFTPKDFDKVLENIAGATEEDRKANINTRLHIDNIKGTKEFLTKRGDEKLLINDFNVGQAMALDNSAVMMLELNKDKVVARENTKQDIKFDIRELEKEISNKSFNDIKNIVFASILNDKEIIEKTENFQKDVSNIGDVVEEKFNKVFDDLGLGFKNNFLINNAEELNLTVSKPERYFSSTDKFGKEYFLQLIDEFDSEYESYEENVDFFLKNLCKEEAKDFEERVLCFGNNFSTNIEDKFTKEEFNADYKLLDKIDKVFEDTFEYAKNKNIDIKNEKELKALTDEVGLNLSDKRYEELVKDEDKEKVEDKKEERKVKDFFDFVDEEVTKDDKEKNEREFE
jgi:hypothetical protein